MSEEIAYAFISNIIGIMGFLGIILLVISPLYIVKIFRENGNMGKPIVTLFFGLIFFLTWLFEGAV